jgi:hypothetical protein
MLQFSGETSYDEQRDKSSAYEVTCQSRVVGPICQYQADHGRPPRELADLVPDYLNRVPDDPFSNQPLIYKATPPEYLLYSVNQDGRDEGGRRSPSPVDGDLFLDPADVAGAVTWLFRPFHRRAELPSRQSPRAFATLAVRSQLRGTDGTQRCRA